MRTLLLCVPLLLLAACMTDRQIMDRTCSHQISLRDSANAALVLAQKIENPTLRQLAIDKVNADLDRLKTCPPIGAAVPTSAATH